MGDRKMYLVGQNKNKNLIDGGKLDNATFILIKGPKNYGKTYLAKYIANHYKMNYMLLDNKVDTIRSLVEVSNKNNNCVYHFKDFDKSSPAAKAALLKIAEETPEGIKIIVTTSAYNFLNTLVSRAYVLDINAYLFEEIKQYANDLNVSQELINKLNDLYIDLTPTLLFKLKDNEEITEILDIAEQTIDCINKGITLEDASIISANFWKDDKDRVILYLDILSKCCHSINSNHYKIACLIQYTMSILNRVAINNYRNLIHNMLMEMV